VASGGRDRERRQTCRRAVRSGHTAPPPPPATRRDLVTALLMRESGRHWRACDGDEVALQAGLYRVAALVRDDQVDRCVADLVVARRNQVLGQPMKSPAGQPSAFLGSEGSPFRVGSSVPR
jgi:hypothetical protein